MKEQKTKDKSKIDKYKKKIQMLEDENDKHMGKIR